MNHYSPIEYLKIDIANQYGLDKKSFRQRIAWVDSVKDLHSKTDQADKPVQYLAAVLALEDAYAGIPSGHLVGLDACASGISILGILIGCHTTSRNTGIIGQQRMDMYAECTKAMNEILGSENEVPREDVKQSQMTHYYGSKAQPKKLFGEDTDELMAFYAAQETVAPGACIMMKEFLNSWQAYALNHRHTLPDGYNAVVPVLQKFKAKIEIDELEHSTLTYIYEDNVGTEKGLAVAANMTHAIDGFLVRETARRCNHDKEHLIEVQRILTTNRGNITTNRIGQHSVERSAIEHKFISLRGAEFITEQSVLNFHTDYREELLALVNETLTRPAFPILTIHDELKAHANHVNDMRKVYQGILAELADSNVGERIIQEVRNDPDYELEKLSTNLGDEIMKSEYFLS